MGQNMVCPNTPLGLVQTPWEPFESDPNKGHTGQTHKIYWFFILKKCRNLSHMFSILLLSDDCIDEGKTPLSLKQVTKQKPLRVHLNLPFQAAKPQSHQFLWKMELFTGICKLLAHDTAKYSSHPEGRIHTDQKRIALTEVRCTEACWKRDKHKQPVWNYTLSLPQKRNPWVPLKFRGNQRQNIPEPCLIPVIFFSSLRVFGSVCS